MAKVHSVARHFSTSDAAEVKVISDILYQDKIAYKISVKSYPLTKKVKFFFTTEPITDATRNAIALKIKRHTSK